MISFAEALDQTVATKRHLLMGNGFSISLFPNCFSYRSLFEEAQSQGLLARYAPLDTAFDALKTTDFEQVMEALKAATKLGRVYGFDTALMAEHAEALKGILVDSIAGRHPSRPNEITEDQYANCRAFLAEFIGEGRDRFSGKAFSLNYDLLFYWAVLHDIFNFDWATGEFCDADQALSHDDGFRLPEDDFDAEYVAWDQFSAAHGQTITYLHGALHLYERGPELAKLCWERSGNKPLMDQIKTALDEDRYPLFVSEGSTAQKMARINKSAYLSKGLRSFAGCCDTKNAALFIIGHSLAANDDHILRRVKNGKISSVYVSLFGDPNSASNLAVRAKAQWLADGRKDRSPLAVNFIDAATLHIWNH